MACAFLGYFRGLSLRWGHNGRDSVSNHQPHDCLLNRLFRGRSKKTSKLRVTGLCVGNSPGTGEFPAQMASNAENVSIWWRHHGYRAFCEISKPNHMGLESSGNSAVKFQSDTTIVIPNLVAYCLLNRGPPYLWHDWFYSTSPKYSQVFVLFCLFSVLSPDWSWILGFTCPHPSLLHH